MLAEVERLVCFDIQTLTSSDPRLTQDNVDLILDCILIADGFVVAETSCYVLFGRGEHL